MLHDGKTLQAKLVAYIVHLILPHANLQIVINLIDLLVKFQVFII